jgi:hypothetical protein
MWNTLTKTQQDALIAIRDCKDTFFPHWAKFEYVHIEKSGVSVRTAKKLAEWGFVRIAWSRNGKKVTGVRLTSVGWDLVSLDGKPQPGEE